MLMYILLIVGFILLVKGADFFVDGAAGVAKLLGVPSVIIGLTIVALGTSAPEASVSIQAGLSGNNDIAVSNVVGSNIFNLLVVVGVCAAIKPFKLENELLKRDFPVNIFASIILLVLTVMLGEINRIAGIGLLVIALAYVFWLINNSLKNRETGEEIKSLSPIKCVIFIVCGLCAVIYGGDMVKENACKIAESWGWSENLIALTIIAIGTSLPELVTSIVAAKKGDSGLALGNVVGSNIFNILLILGLSGTITPITTDKAAIINCSMLLAVTAIYYIFCHWKKGMGRIAGFVSLGTYVAYTTYLLIV